MNPKRAEHLDHQHEAHLRGNGSVRLITRRFEQRLTELDDRNGRLSGAALMLEDPRVIAAQIERLAANLRIASLTGGSHTEDLAVSLGAQTIALCLSLARAEEVRIDASDERGEAAA